MIRIILISLILFQSLNAAGSDFYEGLASGELIGNLNAPDRFGEAPKQRGESQRYGVAIQDGREILVPYGSVAGQ